MKTKLLELFHDARLLLTASI